MRPAAVKLPDWRDADGGSGVAVYKQVREGRGVDDEQEDGFGEDRGHGDHPRRSLGGKSVRLQKHETSGEAFLIATPCS